MTIGLVGQTTVTTFTSPVNGTSPIDANVVRGNDNTVKDAFNVHQADPTVHFQSSLSSARPPAGVQGRKWLDADTYRVYYDDGAAWHEVAYLASDGTSNPVFGNVHITGTLTVDGAATFNGPITVTGPITATGTFTVSPNLILTGPATAPRGVAFQTGGVARWYMDIAGAEGGGNAGGDFALNTYTDGGVQIDTPITIARIAGGALSLNRPTRATVSLVVGVDPAGPEIGRIGGSLRVNGYVLGMNGANQFGGPDNGFNLRVTGTGTADRLRISPQNSAVGGGVVIQVLDNLEVGTLGPMRLSGSAVIAGTDPGSGDFLRVGGSIRTSGNITVSVPGPTAILELNGAAAAANTQVQFANNGAVQWQVGNNVAVGGNSFEFYSTPAATTVFRITPSGAVAVVGNITVSDPTANNLMLSSTTAGVGPIARLARTSATPRTWQLRLGADGSFEIVDETGGVRRAFFDTTGGFQWGSTDYFLVNGTAHNMAFYVNSAAALQILSDQSVVLLGSIDVANGATIRKIGGGATGATMRLVGNGTTNTRYRFYNNDANATFEVFNAAESALMPLTVSVASLAWNIPGFGTGSGIMTVGAPDSGGAGFRMLRIPN